MVNKIEHKFKLVVEFEHTVRDPYLRKLMENDPEGYEKQTAADLQRAIRFDYDDLEVVGATLLKEGEEVWFI
jgi:hypothetical protein